MHRIFWRIPFMGSITYAAALGALACAAYWYVGYRDLSGLFNAYQNGEEEAEQLRQSLEVQTERAEALEAHVAGFSDPVELEAAARRNKNVVREGEKIYRFDLAPERPERTAAPGQELPQTDARNPAQ